MFGSPQINIFVNKNWKKIKLTIFEEIKGEIMANPPQKNHI